MWPHFTGSTCRRWPRRAASRHGQRVGQGRHGVVGAHDEQPGAAYFRRYLAIRRGRGGERHGALGPHALVVGHQSLRVGHVAIGDEKVATGGGSYFGREQGAHRIADNLDPLVWAAPSGFGQRRAQIGGKLLVIQPVLVNGKRLAVPEAPVIKQQNPVARRRQRPRLKQKDDILPESEPASTIVVCWSGPPPPALPATKPAARGRAGKGQRLVLKAQRIGLCPPGRNGLNGPGGGRLQE
ncbi:MAG: hypothetical protein WKG07_35020 [Hymenobacter sp.]